MLFFHLPAPKIDFSSLLVLKVGRYLEGAAEVAQEQSQKEMGKLLRARGARRTFSEEWETWYTPTSAPSELWDLKQVPPLSLHQFPLL